MTEDVQEKDNSGCKQVTWNSDLRDDYGGKRCCKQEFAVFEGHCSEIYGITTGQKA